MVQTYIDTPGARPDFWSVHFYTSDTVGVGSVAFNIAWATSFLAGTPLQGLPLVVSEWNVQFGNIGTSLQATANGGILNSVHLAAMQKLDVAAAFLYTGVDGPFVPYNPLAYPLNCQAEYAAEDGLTNTSDPSRFTFTGKWADFDCTTGAGQIMNFGPSGMGALYADGARKPMAATQQIWTDFAGRFALPTTYDNITDDIFGSISGKRMAASNGIAAVLADDGRECIQRARKTKKEKKDNAEVEKGGNRDSKRKYPAGPRQLVNIMVAQYEKLNPDAEISKEMSVGLKPFLNGLEAFIPILKKARKISQSHVNWKPAKLHKLEVLQQKPRGWTEDFALPININTTETNVQLTGFLDRTEAARVMSKINMTAFLIGGFNKKNGACSKRAGKESLAACDERGGLAGTRTSINEIARLSAGEGGTPPLYLFSFQM